MEKIDLTDLTFLMPIRIDSIDRLINIMMVTEYISDNFNTNIIILEADHINNHLIKKLIPNDIKYIFIEDHDPIFHRTRYINELAKLCKTKFMAIWDADVIVNKEQIVKSIEILRENKADLVYPYKGKFLDTSEPLRDLYFITRDLNILNKNSKKMNMLYPPKPIGGGFIISKKCFSEIGGEDENYYGWGNEDGERFNRIKTVGYNIERVDGYMYHFTHKRGLNSTYFSKSDMEYKNTDVRKCSMFTKNEMTEKVAKLKLK